MRGQHCAPRLSGTLYGFAGSRMDKARSALRHAVDCFTPLGLLSKDWDVSTMRMRGNFPLAYSQVGFIHTAFAASPVGAR